MQGDRTYGVPGLTATKPTGGGANCARCMRGVYIGLAVILALGMSACASIPVTELSGYRAAFDQTYAASQDVLVDYDRTLREAKRRVQERQAARAEEAWQPFPLEWGEVSGQRQEGLDPDVEVRRQALEVIKRYNNALGALADGKSVDELKSSVAGLADSLRAVGNLAGIASPAFAGVGQLAATVAEQLERARLKKEFANALKNGAPVVDQIFQALTADIAEHYQMRAVFNYEKGEKLIRKITDQVVVVKNVYAQRGRPGVGTSFIAVEKAEKRVNDVLAPLNKALLGYPYHFAYASTVGVPAFSANEDAEVQATLAEIERLVQSYNDLKQQVDALAGLLKKYQQTLVDARKGLAVLQRAEIEGARLAPVVQDLLKSAFELKRAFEAYRVASTRAQ